jgi:signal recognition particle receptor subunit beta
MNESSTLLIPFHIFATKTDSKPRSSISKANKLFEKSPENRHSIASGAQLDSVRHYGLLETSYVG